MECVEVQGLEELLTLDILNALHICWLQMNSAGYCLLTNDSCSSLGMKISTLGASRNHLDFGLERRHLISALDLVGQKKSSNLNEITETYNQYKNTIYLGHVPQSIHETVHIEPKRERIDIRIRGECSYRLGDALGSSHFLILIAKGLRGLREFESASRSVARPDSHNYPSDKIDTGFTWNSCTQLDIIFPQTVDSPKLLDPFVQPIGLILATHILHSHQTIPYYIP
ncbi:hypothetical protein Sjap_017436 [Stephania japonica]|uniref:Uncharacterized protein n=1 Tax=Stephania japonica TaxID=461633 RepID=A0AAP0NLZ7_9MAGN